MMMGGNERALSRRPARFRAVIASEGYKTITNQTPSDAVKTAKTRTLLMGCNHCSDTFEAD